MSVKFFEVQTKCGHVGGRSKYIIKSHYIVAESRKEAALKARYLPRVKHDHKDAILSSIEITKDEYLEGKYKNSQDPYFKCTSYQEQKTFLSEDSELILDEPEVFTKHRQKTKNRKKATKYGYLNNHKLETRSFSRCEYYDCYAV